VLDLPRMDDRHGLEAAVGMISYPRPLFRGRTVVGAGVVEQQEGIDLGPQGRVGEERPDGETVPHPVAIRAPVTRARRLDAGSLDGRLPPASLSGETAWRGVERPEATAEPETEEDTERAAA